LVANIAPTGTPALTVAVIAGMAGTGSWLAFLIATIGMLFVAGNIATLARRHPLAGSYFVYIGRTLGPLAGMTAGWNMVAAYLAAAIATVVGGQIFLGYVLDAIGLGAVKPPAWLFDLSFVALVWALAYRDIRISSRVGVVIECLSVAIIILITAIVMSRLRKRRHPGQGGSRSDPRRATRDIAQRWPGRVVFCRHYLCDGARSWR
jgi:amino acid transporter